MNTTFYGVEERWERRFLSRRLADQEIRFIGDPLTAATAERSQDAEVVSVFIHSRVDAAVLDTLPRLRFIAARSTGYDHIDVASCAARDIPVSNVPRYGENTVAEHAFGLILNLSRKIHQANARAKACDFTLSGLEGRDLRGTTLGVIGAGSIGLHVIRIARAFDMNVLVYDVRPQPILAEVLGYRHTTLEELLSSSDIISLHAPLRPETRHMLDRERFGRVRRGALLVNTARGALVETEALLWALDEGILAGAALDVIEGEELLAEEQHLFRTPPSETQLRELACDHRLLRRDDVMYTPHMAWYSREARERILETTVENITAFTAGHPINVVGGDGPETRAA